MAISAPLFNLRIFASITIFDLVMLVTLLTHLYFQNIRTKTFLLFIIFSTTFLVSELNGLFFFLSHGENIGSSINIFARYLILIFIIPYLSYRIFYNDLKDIYRIDLYYEVLMVSFFGVLLFNIYAIFYQIDEYFLLQRFCSIYGNPNTAALVLNLFSVLYLFRLRNSKIWISVLSYISIPLIIFSLVVTGSFSGMLIQIIIFLGFLTKYFNLKVSILLSIFLINFLLVDFSNITQDSQLARGLARFTELKNIFADLENFEILEVGSAGVRMDSINASIYEFFSNPSYIFLGVGFGNVTELINIRTGHNVSVHFVYLQLMLSIGLIGTLTYVIIFLRLIGNIPKYFSGTTYAAQGNIMIIVFILLGAFIPHTYMSFYFAPIFPLLGLYGVKNASE